MHRSAPAASKPGCSYYVGAANLPHDGGYAAKVLAEQSRLRMVAGGRTVAMNTSADTAAQPTAQKKPAQPPQPPVASPAERVALSS